jgi:hypothetical protein
MLTWVAELCPTLSGGNGKGSVYSVNNLEQLLPGKHWHTVTHDPVWAQVIGVEAVGKNLHHVHLDFGFRVLVIEVSQAQAMVWVNDGWAKVTAPKCLIQ